MEQKPKIPGIVEAIVNTVMGVQTDDSKNSSPVTALKATAVDGSAIALYLGGTILQIGMMILALWGLQGLAPSMPAQGVIYPALGFFALVSVRSRLFSPLDNTRSRATDNTVERPRWAPPPLTFPLVWITIGMLRIISSFWVWRAEGEKMGITSQMACDHITLPSATRIWLSP